MIEFWHWWIVAVLLAGVETIAPGAALLWLGGAAAVVGFALLLWPAMPWEGQLLLFAVLSIAAVLGVRAAWGRSAKAPDGAARLNRRAERYIGTRLTLESPIVNGRGRAIVEDGLWTVEGPDLPAGTAVRVIGTDGVILKVEKA